MSAPRGAPSGRRTALRTGLLSIAALTAVSCAKAPLPPSLAGTWIGLQSVSVGVRGPSGSYRYPTDTVRIGITIEADGRAGGYVGGAILENAYVLRNRGWLGRKLHMATDFRLTGRLQGTVFPADPLPTVDVSAPFDLRGDTLTGSLFQRAGPGMVPMTVDLRLVRR